MEIEDTVAMEEDDLSIEEDDDDDDDHEEVISMSWSAGFSALDLGA